MTPMLEAMLSEVQQEAATTRRVLERVPGDKLAWQPHKKSMTLGQLAQHIALVPGSIARIAAADHFELPPNAFQFAQPQSTGEILAAHDESAKAAEDFVKGLTDQTATAMWRMKAGSREVMAMPRAAMLRAIMMNHLYHHRGQLSVYLRLLDVPVPSIYGPSADESPFA